MRIPPVMTVLLGAAAAFAQQAAPHIGYVYPAGGRIGSSVDVTVGGQFLDNPKLAIVSGEGIEAAIVEHKKPMTPAQFNKLREEVEELVKKRAAGGLSAAEETRLADLRLKIAGFIRRPANPALAETVTLRVAIAPNAAPGRRQLRLSTALGITNPLAFEAGALPEFAKPPAQARSEPPAALAGRLRGRTVEKAPQEPLPVTLPAVINGQIMPGGVDRFRFSARKGQRLVASAAARALIPYISDAVPGWFQAVLALYDSKGGELAYADDYRFHPDPVLRCEIPADGDYILEIKDAIYRGREDFVYRITVGELPFITGIFPLGGRAGVKTAVEAQGWNLPAATLSAEPPAAGVYPLSLRGKEAPSNFVPFAADTLPEQTEREPNNLPAKAQAVKWPVIVNGRIAAPAGEDVFRIEGRAGEEIVAEVLARRLDSPLDSFLRLTGASGQQLAANDDHEDRGAGLITHHADSRLAYKFPRNGTYFLHVTDRQGKGGAEYAYRLRIARPRPDFELRVVPASISARPGAAVTVTVYALRKDGFSGDIALRLKDAPPGFALSGAWVPAGQEQVRLTLSAPPRRMDAPVRLHLEGRATIEGREVRRAAVPAEQMTQAFAYQHLVPAEDWLVQVSGPARQRVPWKLAGRDPVKLPAGGRAPVEILMPVGRYASLVDLALNEPPEGIAIQGVSWGTYGVSVLLGADAAKVKPGMKGNLILEAFLERVPEAGGAKKQAANRRQPLGLLPAIPFEVVGR